MLTIHYSVLSKQVLYLNCAALRCPETYYSAYYSASAEDMKCQTYYH